VTDRTIAELERSLEEQPSFLATPRGKLTLALLCAVGFLDFVDASIVNVALPHIRGDLHFSAQGLQWVLSGYLLTYGGFMLLGGRLGDLLGRRRVLVAGTTVFAAASTMGGFAGNSGVLVTARLIQGLGAAMMLPAALSLLTTSFRDGPDRHKAFGVWGGVGGLASAVGVLAGGVLTDGPGWRWVLFVNPPICVLILAAVFVMIPRDRPPVRQGGFDLTGAVLVTGAMLLLVYTLVKAPDVGWGSGRTVLGLIAAGVLLVAFVLNEARLRHPLVPLSVFRIPGVAAADVTQLIAIAGLLSMFYFLTLYMQNILGYSPLKTGAAYLPLCFGVGIAAGISSKLLARTGTRPVAVVGALVAAGGLALLARVPVGGSYLTDLLPGLMIVSFGLGAVFVAITTAANAGVPAHQAGLAAALLNASQQVGGALGLAIFSAVATSRTQHLLAAHAPQPHAVAAGFHRALLTGAAFVVASALIALRSSNTRGEADAETKVRELVPAQGGHDVH
jgi:EmrB/QacA subfamily drug resistance transporter